MHSYSYIHVSRLQLVDYLVPNKFPPYPLPLPLSISPFLSAPNSVTSVSQSYIPVFIFNLHSPAYFINALVSTFESTYFRMIQEDQPLTLPRIGQKLILSC